MSDSDTVVSCINWCVIWHKTFSLGQSRSWSFSLYATSWGRRTFLPANSFVWTRFFLASGHFLRHLTSSARSTGILLSTSLPQKQNTVQSSPCTCLLSHIAWLGRRTLSNIVGTISVSCWECLSLGTSPWSLGSSLASEKVICFLSFLVDIHLELPVL